MSKRVALVGGVVGLLGVGALVGSFAPALSQVLPTPTPGATNVGDPNQRTIVAFLPNKRSKDHEVDVGKERFGPGDFFVGTGALVDPGTQNTLGRATYRCQIVRINRASKSSKFICDLTARFTEGSLTVHGAPTFTQNGRAQQAFAITGGTGDYSEARGTVGFADSRRGPTFTFNIILH